MKRITTAVTFCVVYLVCAIGARPQQASAPIQDPGPATPSIFIRIEPDHMEPKQVTVNHGKLIILVQNHSTAPNVKLSLDHSAGANVDAASLQPTQHHFVQAYNLTPGTYVLSEKNHPAWTCTITVN